MCMRYQTHGCADVGTLTDSYVTKVSVHMCEDVHTLMNLRTRVRHAAGLIRNTGMEPE